MRKNARISVYLVLSFLPLLLMGLLGLELAIAAIWGPVRNVGGWLTSSGIVLALYIVGFGFACRCLLRYRSESQHLPEYATLLDDLADKISMDAAILINQTPDELGRELPPGALLRRRLEETLRALQCGVPLLAPNRIAEDDCYFSSPERALGAFRDSAFYLGIAGTLFTVFAAGISDHSYGYVCLLSTFAGLVASVGLRLCQSALREQRDELSEQTETLLSDHFVRKLRREIVSPEARLIAAVSNSLARQEALSAKQLDAHVTAMQQMIVERLAAPISRLESHTGALSVHVQTLAGQSGAWSELARDLKAEQARYLQAAQPEQASPRPQEAVTEVSSGAVEARIAFLEEQIAATLAAFATQLPGTLRDGIREALAGTVEMADAIREQAGLLAHRVDQVSQNAERQLQAYSQWHERAEGWQAQLEAALKTGQATQADLLQGWQEQATRSLVGVQTALNTAAQGMRRDYDLLSESLRQFAARVEAMEASTKGIHEQLQALPTPVRDLRAAMTQVAPTLSQMSTVVRDLNETTKTLREREQAQTEQTREALQRLIQSMGMVIERMNAVAVAQGMGAGGTSNGHVP